MARAQSQNRRWNWLLDARYARKSEGLSTARKSKTRVWLSGNEAGGALLPGQRRTLGGGARNFTGPRKPALSTTLVSPQSARYPLSRPGILLLLFHPLSPSARRRFSHAFASTAPGRFSTRQTAG